MLDILYNDLPADEFQFELACEGANLRADRAVATYRAVCEKAELDLREAELICVQEAGGMDDLEDLYMEAEEKTDDKKKGILGSVWSAIKSFFKKIKEFFTGKKSDIDPKSKGQINEGTDNFFKRGLNAIKSFFSKVKSAISEHKVASIALAAVTTLGGVVAVRSVLNKHKGAENEAGKAKDPKETSKVVTISGATALQYIEAGNSLCDEGEKMATELADMKIEDPTVLELAKALIHQVGSTIKAQMGKIVGVFTHLKDKVTDKFSKKNGEAEDSDDSSDDDNGGDNGGNNNQPNTKDSGNKLEDKSGNNTQKIEDKNGNKKGLPDKQREAGVKGGAEAGAEWERNGRQVREESALDYDPDYDVMIESSADYDDYDDEYEDSYTESGSAYDDDDLDDLLGDLL